MACFTATLCVILSGFLTISAANKDTCDFYASIGQNTLTLPASLDYKSSDNTFVLRWRHNGSIIYYGQTGRVTVGKAADISPTGSLQLKNLKASSAGIYEADVLDLLGTSVKKSTARLCVMETVLKPEVKFVCDSKAGAVTLTCHVAKPQGLTFTWMLDEKTLSSETKQTLSISLAQLKGHSNFTCSAANKVSREKSNTLRLPCKAPEPAPEPAPQAAMLCFKPKVVLGALAGGASLILLLLIIIVVMCCRRRRNQTPPSPGNTAAGQVQMISMNQQQQPDPIGPRCEQPDPIGPRCEQPDPIGPDYDYEQPDDPVGHLYETMHEHCTEAITPSHKMPPKAYDQAVPLAGAQRQEKPPQGSRGAEGERCSPVPKPRLTLQVPVN